MSKTVSETFADAMRAYEGGKPAEARRLARAIAESAPQFGGAHYLLGLLALDQNQGRRAADHLAQAIAITPGQAVLHHAMGRALEMAGDNAEAMLHFQRVLSLSPNHADAHARLGLLLGKADKPGDAVAHLRRAVEADARHAEALNGLGALLHAQGKAAEAAEFLRRALELRPDWAVALNNFGVVLKDLGRLEDAVVVLDGAVELRPKHVGSRINLAAALRAAGRAEAALKQAEKATKLEPRAADAWLELGLARQAQGHAEAAAAAFERAAALKPGWARTWYCLGEIRRALHQNDKAAQAYGKCLELDPADLHGAALGLALAGAAPVPDKAPAAYVRQLFDDYAESFDHALVHKLEYRAPALLAEALGRCLDRREGLAVMDAGCGTGLAAPVLRPLAARLDGVDLSPSMVAKAGERGLYDELVVGELVEALAARPARYDLIVAADVLVYLGDLAPVLTAAASSLKPGGAFAFTVEKSEDTATYCLGAKHRYAHAAAYVREAAAAAGFTVKLQEDAVTRQEAGAGVPGMVVVLGKG